MARLVQSPRKRRPSVSSEASSSSSGSSAGSRIVVKRRGSASVAPSARSASTGTLGKARLIEIQPMNLTQSRRSTRLSSATTGATSASSPGHVIRDRLDKLDRPESRNVSGVTLVNESEQQILNDGISALDLDWSVDKLYNPAEEIVPMEYSSKNRKSARLSTLLTTAVASTASTLGKRTREAVGSGKEKLQAMKENKRSSLRPRAEEPIPAVNNEPPRKKTRVSVHSAPNLLTITETRIVATPQIKPKKRWLSSGLYTGQDRDFNPRLTETKNRIKRLSSKKPEGDVPHQKLLPLPMFAGERLLESGREFKLPFDIFSPLPPGQPRPYDWRKTSTNLFIGDAASEWKRHKPLPASRCLCAAETGCDEECQNRYMLYECDDNNCNIGVELCTNRSFAKLKERYQSGRKYDIGVEVMKTAEKGFGVRACRTFDPHQIIVEYAGEIITKDECLRRMKNEYKDNECYYLMTFDQKMIIDATRGSIARFINHSCEPNCRMIKWTVAGKPRMALFAGDNGIMTGEELTYDYNFDPFSQKNVQTCRCGTPSCRGFLGPRPTKLVREKEMDDVKPKQTAGILSGTKRKLQHFLGESNATNKLTHSLSGKKRRATTDGLNSMIVQHQSQRRITSASTGGSTIIGKENVAPASRLRGGSSRNSPVENNKYRVTKRTSPPQQKQKSTSRNTLGALSRVASSLKRNASSLKRNASTLKRNASTLKSKASLRRSGAVRKSEPLSGASGSKIAPFEPLTLDFEGGNTGVAKVVEAATRGNETVWSPSARSMAGSARKGVVRSVKGQRRADAMRRMGLGGNGKVGRSVRVVEGDE